MKIKLNLDKCIAAGSCVMEAPEIFDQRDEDGVVVLLDSDPASELAPLVRRAAAACPAGVIAIEE